MWLLYRVCNLQVEIIGTFDREENAVAVSEKFGDTAIVSKLPLSYDKYPFDLKKWMKIYESIKSSIL